MELIGTRSRRTGIGRLLAVVVVAGAGLAVGVSSGAAAGAPCGSTGDYSTSGTTATCAYTSAGTEDTFSVPTGVTSLSVTAVGASGGIGSLAGDVPGAGAVVVNTGLPVPTGASTLWVVVGGPGGGAVTTCPDSIQAPGGFPDGGPSGSNAGCEYTDGGGGGSSAVLTEPRATAVSTGQLTGNLATDARLLVAGGGGGGAGGVGESFTPGGSAGDSTVTGAGAGGCGVQGGAGGVGPTDGSDGGGAGDCGLGTSVTPSAPGTAATGGEGSNDDPPGGYDGAGGGGGWFGGGGSNFLGSGGGGSSYGGAGPSNGISITTASSSQASEVEISWTIPNATPSISTQQEPASATVGSSIADKASVSGGDSPTGTVTFNVYNNSNGTGTPLFTDTENLVGGSATSKSYTPTAVGTDYWVVTYNGDSNNQAVTSATDAEPVKVTVTPASLCLLTGRYVEGSAKFQALPPAQQRLIEALVTAVCRPLNSISARLTAKQTAALIAAYDTAVNGLAATGWLTSGQASNLKALAATLSTTAHRKGRPTNVWAPRRPCTPAASGVSDSRGTSGDRVGPRA